MSALSREQPLRRDFHKLLLESIVFAIYLKEATNRGGLLCQKPRPAPYYNHLVRKRASPD